MSRGDGEIKSYFLKDRDPMSCWDRTAISFSKYHFIFIPPPPLVNTFSYFIAYLWYTQWKPFLMLALAIIFTCLSILVLVAELLYCFGVKNDILYNLLVAPELDAASNYIVDNVSIFTSILIYIPTYPHFIQIMI